MTEAPPIFPLDPEPVPPSPEVIEAARWWLWGEGRDAGSPAIPQLKRRFGLSARDACLAIREASLIRARSL